MQNESVEIFNVCGEHWNEWICWLWMQPDVGPGGLYVWIIIIVDVLWEGKTKG